MPISVFELLKIGIGPSSSHTVGPMKAAKSFINLLKGKGLFNSGISRVEVELYGSLALTGKGHGTDKAVILGLLGEEPDTVDIPSISERFNHILTTSDMNFNHEIPIKFNYKQDLVFYKKKVLPFHTNGIIFKAYDSKKNELLSMPYYSIGGGFILSEDETKQEQTTPTFEIKYPFKTSKELVLLCEEHNMTIPELVMENEKMRLPEAEVIRQIDRIWEVMDDCIENGLRKEGNLPGPLNVKRRAPVLFNNLNEERKRLGSLNLLQYLDYVCAYALAVSEENAAGGRIVTAPTNGAAGVIPAVLKYVKSFHETSTTPNLHRDFLLTATAIGSLFKMGASISGAEGGCQAEIGTACAMAAAGLTQILGGNIYQITNSANIGAEHNLGLTCDPIFGLVQVPCIERNSMAAIKSITAANLAMRGDGKHIVSLDRTIRVMKRTGDDMKKKYKETALGGLAWDFYSKDDDGNERPRSEKIKFGTNIPEC